MKQGCAILAMLLLAGCTVVKVQKMVNAEGREHDCTGRAEASLGMSPQAWTLANHQRDLCVTSNRQRGWLPVEEVGRIPLRFGERNGQVFVAEVLPGVSALLTLGERDVLRSIDGVPVVSLRDAEERLFGMRGTPVRLTLDGPKGEREIQLVRD